MVTQWVVTLDETSAAEPAWAACLRALPGLQDVRVTHGSHEPTSVCFSTSTAVNVRTVGEWAKISFGVHASAAVRQVTGRDAAEDAEGAEGAEAAEATEGEADTSTEDTDDTEDTEDTADTADTPDYNPANWSRSLRALAALRAQYGQEAVVPQHAIRVALAGTIGRN